MAQPTPPDKPLSYPSSQHILQYMEANRRYALVARCPSLRSAHHQAPLIVNYLKLNEKELILNDYLHEFIVGPKHHVNVEEKVEEDFAEAEVKMEQPKRKEPKPTLPRVFKSLEHTSFNAHLEDRLMDFLQVEREAPVKQPETSNPTRRDRADALAPVSPKRRRETLASTALSIVSKTLVPEPEKPPVPPKPPKPSTDCIQFTMKKLPGLGYSKNFFEIPKTMGIDKAIRSHIGNVFNQKILVRHFEVDGKEGIRTVPNGRFFRVCNLSVDSELFSPVQRILNFQTSPLHKLTLTIARGHDHLLHDPILLSFPKLHATLKACPDAMDKVYLRLPHQELYVSGIKASVLEIGEIVESMVARNRPVGTKFSMEIKFLSQLTGPEAIFLGRVLDVLGAQRKIIDGSKKCGCIPMMEQKELVIYTEQQEAIAGIGVGPWALVLEVVELGRTTAME